MKQGFLEQESKKANKRNRTRFLSFLFVYICLVSVISFALKDSIDLNEYKSQKVVACLVIITGIMLISVVVGLAKAARVATNGKNLILPFKENTKEEVG